MNMNTVIMFSFLTIYNDKSLIGTSGNIGHAFTVRAESESTVTYIIILFPLPAIHDD